MRMTTPPPRQLGAAAGGGVMGDRILLILDNDETGQAIVNGKAYRVRGSYNESYGWAEHGKRRIQFTLILEESLDEEAQRRRIAGLEAELRREQERLEEIQAVFKDEDR
jgi:hypothetical protein